MPLKDISGQQIIKVACAFRHKYRKGQKLRLSPCMVGFHPKNRGRVKLSGVAVMHLLLELLEKGFDPEEADCGGIVIESTATSMVMDYNKKACDGDPLLVATIDDNMLGYGTIAHSHLNQVLKNILGGIIVAEEHLPALDARKKILLAKIKDDKARLSVSMLKNHDPTYATYAAEGLMFEILSGDMEVEEPDAADIIQSAQNMKNSIALIPHEMEAIRLTSTFCSASAALAADITFTSIQEKLAQSMSAVAYDPDFINVFKLVIQCGADEWGIIEFFCDFLVKFVDPARRRLRLTGFSVVTDNIPEAAPLVRIAALLHAYCQPPKNQFCEPPDRYVWKALSTKHGNIIQLMNELLMFFYTKPHLKSLNNTERLKFLGNLYKDSVGAVSEKSHYKKELTHGEQNAALADGIKLIARNYKEKFTSLTKNDCEDMPIEMLPASSGSGAAAAAAAAASPASIGAPKEKKSKGGSSNSAPDDNVAELTKFDIHGVVVESTPQLHVPQPEYRDWKTWASDAELLDKRAIDVVRAKVFEHVVDLWINRPMDPDVEFIKAPGSKSWRVCATIDFAVNEIVMVPYAGNPAGVVTKKPTSPNATCVTLEMADGKTEVTWLAPDITWNNGAADISKPHHSNSRSVYWACARSHENANCKLVNLKVSVVRCTHWHGLPDPVYEPYAATDIVTIPVIINDKPIKKGEQLIVLCDPPPKKPAETKEVKDNKRKEPTWFAAAKKADVKRKQ
jgi:hypothetical protein